MSSRSFVSLCSEVTEPLPLPIAIGTDTSFFCIIEPICYCYFISASYGSAQGKSQVYVVVTLV